MAELLRLSKPAEPPPAPGGFIETETARDILRSLHLVRATPGSGMTVISGAPGVGKTFTLKHFMRSDPDLVYVAVARGEGTPSRQAFAFCDKFGIGRRGLGLPSMRQAIHQFLVYHNAGICLDEAQYLDSDALEWWRIGAEEAGRDLVLVGDLTLTPKVRQIEQLESRMLRPVVIKGVRKADVAELARAAGCGDPAAVGALHAVAALKGGMRNVQNVLRTAGLFASGEVVTAAHLKAAIVDMKLDQKGGK